MYNFQYSFFSHFFQYIEENLYCLFYGIELLATRYSFFASYFDLLADLSEAFGVWIALLVLMTSTITAMAVIQQVTTSSKDVFKLNVSSSNLKATNNFVQYKYFLNFIATKNNKLF